MDENTISILIATDNHLGYNEKDRIRGNDSFDTFEEILQIAQQNDVDMVLLGGDLFHDNKPTRKTLHKTLELLRYYCLGDRPCELEIVSDQSVNFPNRFACVNYQDPNFNISMPVFSIHGNHDDPSGDGNLAALDLLSVAGLVNYFGRCKQVDDIAVDPILFRKGNCRLALYGIGNVRDERLFRTFKAQKVRMRRPIEERDDWFNLLVIHQNRIAHKNTSYIPESFLSSFLNLVVWGHEHECIVDPQKNEQQDFWITQPGSSVATSLCEAESKEKHIAIVRITKNDFELEKIPLKTVRPFIMDDMDLSGVKTGDMKAAVKAIIQKITSMIPETEKLPLVRLRVDYTGFGVFSPRQIGQLFVSKVANPLDMLLFTRKKQQQKRKEEIKLPERLTEVRVEEMVRKVVDLQSLDIFKEQEITQSVEAFVQKHDNDAIREFTKKSLQKTKQTLMQSNESIEEMIQRLK